MTVPDFEHRLAQLDLHPLVLAIEFEQGGRWWPGRATGFVQDQAGWHVSVTPERDSYRSGARPGWCSPDQVRPGQHPVRTTNGKREWGHVDRTVQLPAELAYLDRCASNLHERQDRST